MKKALIICAGGMSSSVIAKKQPRVCKEKEMRFKSTRLRNPKEQIPSLRMNTICI